MHLRLPHLLRFPRFVVPVVAVLALAVLTACDVDSSDGWTYSSSESGIDGTTLVASKEFHPDGVPTFFRAKLACRPKTNALTFTLDSYESDDRGHDTYPPSPYVRDASHLLTGRLAYTDLQGRRMVMPAAILTTPDYVNVAVWDLQEFSAATWYATDSARFFDWAERHGGAALGMTRAFAGVAGFFASLGAEVQGIPLDVIAVASGISMARSTLPQVHDANALATLAPGQMLRSALPVTFELANTGGKSEVTLPASNRVIERVLTACAGTTWWHTSTPHTRAVTQAGAPVARPMPNEPTTPMASQAADSASTLPDTGPPRLAPAPQPADADHAGESTPDPATTSAAATVARAATSADNQTYFEFQVEQQAAPIRGTTAPAYPDALRGAHVEGEVLAQFVVDTTGRPDPQTFKVLKSSHDLFTAAVKTALPTMRFRPAEVGGRRVRQLVQMPFPFRLP